MENLGVPRNRPDDGVRRTAPSRPLAAPTGPVPKAPEPQVEGDRGGVNGEAALASHAGPLGEQAMATAAADDFDGFEGFGSVSPAQPPVVAYLQGTLAKLHGAPGEAIAATAALLGDPRSFVAALNEAKALRGTPAFARARADIDEIAKLATPARLAELLGKVPAVPPEAQANLQRLQALPDPALKQAIEAKQPKKGLIEGLAGGIGGALKFATDGVGKLAHGAIDVTGRLSTFGLDLGAAALDAVGAKGAADATRSAGKLVRGAYDAVGNQLQLFAEGVGSAFRDTVTGIGTTIAHPIETVKGIAHLVAHPSELPKVAKALWDTATEKGPAYAIGYVAGNLLPAVLSGGSSTGGTLTARVAAIAGESRVLSAAGEALSAAGKASGLTRAAAVVGKGYSTVAEVAGKTVAFTTRPLGVAGRLVGDTAVVRRAAAFVRESSLGRTAVRLDRAIENRVVGLNDAVDSVLRGGARRLDGTGLARKAEAAGASAEQKAAEAAARARQAELLRVKRDVPARELTAEDRRLLDAHGAKIEHVEEMNRKGLGKNPGSEHKDKLVSASDASHDKALEGVEDIQKNRGLYHDRKGALDHIGNNRVEDGAIYEGARPRGEMPNVRVNFTHEGLNAARSEARKLAEAALSPEEKLRRVVAMVGGEDGKPGLLRAASSSKATDDLFNAINRKNPGAKFRLEELDTYLDAHVGDCRHFALTNQALLQEAVPELNPRVVYTVTFEKAQNGTAVAVNHAFNVVTIKGEDVVVDSILPHFTGGKVKDYVHQGLFGREVRFVQDRFQTLPGRWSAGGALVNRNVAAASIAASQQRK